MAPAPRTIDLNSDLGESFGAWTMGADSEMLAIVSSANIACGFHAGDPAGILRTLTAARAAKVRVGAHVGYRDLVGFGRRALDPSSEELTADVIYQIGALQGLARAAGVEAAYVKPHGALYNQIAFDPRQAADVIQAIRRVDPDLILVALAGSPLIEQARAEGLRVVGEAFADRAYTAEGKLVARRETGALLHDPEAIAKRILTWIDTGSLESIDGTPTRLAAQTLCVHGDNPGAVAIAQKLRAALEGAGIAIRPFADPAADGG